jgi:putative transposase
MPKKHQNKALRLKQWDYRNAGAYFITICTKNRAHYFGEITKGKMQLSSIGVIADILWHEIKNHTNNTELGEYIVMPNHVHGIIILKDNPDLLDQGHALDHHGENRFQNIGKNSISSIVGSYKSAVTKHARRLGYEFAWQSRFHDHIIRNQESYERISAYIKNNPINWDRDTFQKTNQ